MSAPKSTYPRDAARLCSIGHFNCFCDVKSLYVPTLGNEFRKASFSEIRDAYEAAIRGQHPDFVPAASVAPIGPPELPL